MRILIIEDEPKIAEVISSRLKKENYVVDINKNGEEGLDNALTNIYDLIILDVMLPKINGFEILKQIRKEKIEAKVIMLTAKSMLDDKLTGFNSGANDYITKPFSVRELMARVKANLRKNEVSAIVKETAKEIPEQKENEESVIKVNDLELDLDRFEVKVRGNIIDLTLREFEVLKFLAAQPGQVITRETLLEKVWGYEYYGDIRTVDVTVRRIREKIEKDTSSPKILITKRGVGYYIATK